MGKRGKKYEEARKKVDRTKRYDLEEALHLLPET
ncbi:MAG: 50S ribosomal protein L1, partial [Deltaproteobacteria bacterium]